VHRIVTRERILLKSGYHVEYHWVPGHSKIEGNEIAEGMTRQAATTLIQRGTGRLLKAENFTSLSHLHRQTKERKWKEAKDWLEKNLDNRPGYILPTTQQPDPIAMQERKRLATRYYQLKIGHAVIGTHLKRINSLNDDSCWWCESQERQTVEHLIKRCRKWRKERETLRKKTPRGVWHHRKVCHLFASRECTAALLEFIENTEVGNRKEEKEMKIREEERDEEMGWEDLHDDEDDEKEI
jgi:hypothetical protein